MYNRYRNIKHVGLKANSERPTQVPLNSTQLNSSGSWVELVRRVDNVCRRLTRRCRSLIDWTRWRATWRWVTRLSSQKCRHRATRSTRGYRSCVNARRSRCRHCTSASCGFATSDESASSPNRHSMCENCVFCREWSAPPRKIWTRCSFRITSSIFCIRRTMSWRCA